MKRQTPTLLLAPDGNSGAPAPPLVPSLAPLPVEFSGALRKPDDISGAAVVGDFLLIVSDEAKNPTVVQVLKKNAAGYGVVRDIPLTVAGNDEVDLEAVAADGDTVYVTGSHAWARKIEGAAIGDPRRKESREQFFRFKLNGDGSPGPVEGPKSLTPFLKDHPVLKGFVGVASKENGIDIEGLAVKDNRLYFGFRAPVLRYGWVPVVSCTWADPAGSAKVLYVKLEGRGIRDLVRVDDGFLILAGPPGDGDCSYRVYYWDGNDQLPYGEAFKPQALGEFPDLGPGKPESLALLKAAGKSYDLLLLCDGLPNGGPTLWKLTRP